jgi:hypothetical protein
MGPAVDRAREEKGVKLGARERREEVDRVPELWLSLVKNRLSAGFPDASLQ